MKIFKEINSRLTETEIVIRTFSEAEYQKVAHTFDERLRLNTTEGLCLIKRSDVLYIEALRNYLEVHTAEKFFTVRSPLYKMKELLGSNFVQVSRSYLINFQQLTAVEADIIHGMVARVGGLKVPVSRTYLKNLYQRMEADE